MSKNNQTSEKLSDSGRISRSKKLVLIDGNALIHRAYHALPPLTNKKGELVNAVYGFASTLLSVIEKFQPDYILATFDLKGPTFRHKEYNEYKATRVKAPDELYAQIGRVKEIVRAFNIPIYEKEGFEADDIIGTIVKQSEKSDLEFETENIIVTGDLDTLQLVSPKTKVYALRRGISDTVIYDEKGVEEKYGLKPEQIVDFKGLRGDASDNIPGVKGVGEKTASDLLKRYKTIEGVYGHLAEIKSAVREKLERDRAQAILSKKLATIVSDAPVKLILDEAMTRDFDRKKIIGLFQELNFFSLIKRLPESSMSGAPIESGETDLLAAKFNGVKDFKFELIAKDKCGEFIEELKKQEEVAIYLRTTGDKYYNSDLLGAAFCWKRGRAGYVSFREVQGLKHKIQNILEDGNIKKIGYDLKYVYEVLKKHGIDLQGELYDVMLAAYVLNPGGKIEFKNLVLEELGEEIEAKTKTGQMGLEIESEEMVAQKICRVADYIFKLKASFEEKINIISQEQGERNLKAVLGQVEFPLIKILAQMEMAGIKLNTVIFQGISKNIGKKIEHLEKSIHELGGGPFNVNSPKQLREVLFEKLKIPTDEIKKTKTGLSTASSELQKIKDKHKIIEKIEEYRELFKLKTTYLDTLPELVDKKSRIHTTFNQAVTATGRLSSSDPNLQNIPIRTDLGQVLRTAFVAEDGYKLVSADYSQIDLRVAAHVSGDKKMIGTFLRGEDAHRTTAAEINKVAPSQVTEKMRRAAKALNFGVIYGMSVFGFSEAAGIEREEAKKFIDAYMEKFSGVAKYMRDTKEFARKHGYVETELGRRRYVPEINSPNFQVANSGERMAINMPIQGLAADIVKLAMVGIWKEYGKNPDVRIILQIHDEVLLEVKEDIAGEAGEKVREIMENAHKISVPLAVNVKIGDNWGEI